MKKLLLMLTALASFALAGAQVPVPTVTVNHTVITNVNGDVLASGTECLTPVDGQGNPTPGNYSGNGVPGSLFGTFTRNPVCHDVVNGSVASFVGVPRTDFSNPQICYGITITDKSTGALVIKKGDGFDCIKLNTATLGVASGGLIDLHNVAPYHSNFQTPQQGLTGQTGATGATGCVVAPVGSTCTTDFIPQTVGHVVDANQMTGADIGAKINAGFAKFPGASGAPTRGALVLTEPGAMQHVTTQIRFPNQVTSPYVFNPVLDCQGGGLLWAGSTTTDMVYIPPEAANNAGNQSLEIKNCTLQRNDITANVVTAYSRGALKLTNVEIVGGLNGLNIVSTTNGAVAGASFEEEMQLINVGFKGCGSRAISVTIDPSTPGSGSTMYTWWQRVKFDLDGTCKTGMYAGPYIQMFGVRFDYQFNINGGTDIHLFTIDGTVLSSDATISGEATAVPSGTIWAWDGNGVMNVGGAFIARMGVKCVSQALAVGCPIGDGTGVYGAVGGAYSGESIGPRNFISGANLHLYAVYGSEFHGYDQWSSCATDDTTQNVANSKTCSNRIYSSPGGVAFGSHWHDSSCISCTAIPYALSWKDSMGSVPTVNSTGFVRNEYSFWDAAANFFHDIYVPNTPGQPGGTYSTRLYDGDPTPTPVDSCQLTPAVPGMVTCNHYGSRVYPNLATGTKQFACISASGALYGSATACLP